MKRFRGGEGPENKMPEPQIIPPQNQQLIPPQNPQEMPQENPQEMPQENPQEMPQENPQEMPQENPQEIPQENPQENPQEIPQENPQLMPQENQQLMPPQENQQLMPPQENPQLMPQENQQLMPPQETSQLMPQESQQMMPPQEMSQELPEESQKQEISQIEPTGEGESTEIEAFRNMMGASPEAQQVYLYMNTNISTEENRDKSYKREGVLHFTDSVSVGADQKTIMSLGSVIGSRGIETTTYDKLRNVALQKVGILIGENRRCYNTKFDFERNGETILVHIYGTVYAKKENAPIV